MPLYTEKNNSSARVWGSYSDAHEDSCLLWCC